MAINSIKFILFCLIVLVLYFLSPKKDRWKILLLESYLFYYISCGKLIIFLLITSLSIYLASLYMKDKDKKNKKIVLISTILFNVLILFVLKYLNVFSGLFKLNSIFKFAIPLGISYYTLQAIGYITDVYRNKYKPESNFFKLSLFLCYFPLITEGPISRYDKLSKTLYEGKSIEYDNLKYGFYMILFGYFKKMVIADRCAIFVNDIFSKNVTGLPVFVAIILYTIQIYAEFSACMDIVIGFSKMLGIELESNFKRPFFSKDIQEFWRRWHVTLGAWLKDYIFYPISLSKINMNLNKKVRKKFKNNFGKVILAAFPLFFVWITNGVWHGVGVKYIFYGMYYYVLMILGLLLKPVFNLIIGKLKINTNSKYYKLFQILRTCLIVCIGMLIFRADSVGNAFNMFINIFKGNSISLINKDFCIIDYIIVILFIVIMIIKGLLEEKNIDVYKKIDGLNIVVKDLIFILVVLLIIVFGIYGPEYNVQDFIYGGF